MLQRYDVCKEQLSAKLLFMAGSTTVSLVIFVTMVKPLCRNTDGDVTEDMLLKLPAMTVSYNANNIISGLHAVLDNHMN